MIDINNISQTPILVFSNLLLLALFFFRLRPALHTSGYRVVQSEVWTVLWILLFCVFSFWGADWFGYLSYFVEIKRIGPEHVPMESVYLWLMDILPHYLLFRLVVWGVAIVLLCILIHQYDVNRGVFWFFFCSISIIWFSYARATLAMVAMFCGLSLMYSDWKKPWLVRVMGILLIVASYFLHKSSLLGIVPIIIAMVWDKLFNRNTAFWLIVIFIALFGVSRSYFVDFFTLLTADDDLFLNEYAVAGSSHLYDSTRGLSLGWGTRLVHIFERVPLYLLAFGCIKTISGINRPPRPIRIVMISFCSILFFASIFALDIGMNTSLLHTRLLRFCQIPFCVCLTYFYQNGKYPKLIRLTYIMAILGAFYAVTYSLYNAFTI